MKKCSFCGKESRKVCDICKTPYCSVDCQRKDWPEHKKLHKIREVENKKLDELYSECGICLESKINTFETPCCAGKICTECKKRIGSSICPFCRRDQNKLSLYDIADKARKIFEKTEENPEENAKDKIVGVMYTIIALRKEFETVESIDIKREIKNQALELINSLLQILPDSKNLKK